MDDTDARPYFFEAFRLDPRIRELRRLDGTVVPLTAKAFDTLCYLVEHRERVVGKDELLSAIWAGRVVEENNLSQAITAVRRALGTGPSEHRYLVTVPGHGYRFVAEVRAHADPATDAAAEPGNGNPAATGVEAIIVPGHGAAARRMVWLGAVLFMVALFAIAAWRLRAPQVPGAAAAPMATLAVLPFRALSPGAGDDLLELGLADTLVTRLGRSDALRVRSLASVRQLADPDADAATVGSALGAAYVVEGSTQRSGDQVRVNARLLATADGRVLWSETFDTRADRAFGLQDRITQAVSAALQLQPPAVPPRPSSPCDGDDAPAYRALLRAEYRLHRRDVTTVAAYQDAIRRDPTCSRAYAGLAVAYMFLAHNDAAPGEVFPLARAAVEQALRIDPDSAEALTAQGRYLQLFAWNWRDSERSLRRAIALNSSLPDAHFGLGHLLVTTGRFDEGLAQARQAGELDPLSPFINSLMGGFLSAAGQPEAARARVARALEQEPDFWVALMVRGGLAMDAGEHAAAVADLQRSADHSNRNSQVLAVLAAAHVAAGERAQAEAILAELQARSATGYVPATSLAAVHAALGDTQAALGQLERARAAHDIRMAFLKVDARWNPLRREPRFRALAHQMGLESDHATGRF